MTREVVVVAGCRTAQGTFGGTLRDVPAHELLRPALGEVVRRMITASRRFCKRRHLRRASACTAARAGQSAPQPVANARRSFTSFALGLRYEDDDE